MSTPLAQGAAGDGARRDAARGLLERFAQGWNNAEPNRMAEVFRLDGIFQPGPFETSIKGRAAILDYWRDVPLAQSEVAFRYGEIFLAGPWFAAEFKCTYVRQRTGETVDVRGALFCETKNDQVAEMRMYFERRVTPRTMS